VNLTPSQFQMLDHLHTLDADHTPVEQADLATTLGVDDKSVERRMRRLVDVGLVDVVRSDHRLDPVRYAPSEIGRAAYRMQLLVWDGVTAPPVLDESVAHASLAAYGLTHYGTEAAA
jgi:Mn-dependent DtxR family transcriptional regulator